MRVQVDNCQYDANAANTVVFKGETLLSGVYTDLGDDYVFIPEQETEDYFMMTLKLQEEDVISYDLDSYDPNGQPFCFIINSLCRGFRKELDTLQVGDE